MKIEIELNGEIIRETSIKELKKGEFFTKKPIASPKDCQVWIKGDYCRDIKKYECISWNDINRVTYIAGNKPAYVDFTF